MEKHLTDFSCFAGYRQRQVVLNYYQDEDFLWKRDGFFFKTIRVSNQKLFFLKNDGNTEVINTDGYESLFVNTEFPNYYILRNGTSRLEIYFP